MHPLRFDPSYEQPEPDEAQTTEELIKALRGIAEKTARDYGKAVRSVHAKSHGLLYGELEVLPNLPPELAQGLFAHAAIYDVAMRLSTSPGDLLDDSVSTPRGLGLKVLGVKGPRVAGSEDATTQDFVMVNGPAFLAPNA
ncbi:MAG: catalase, partial [Rhizobacter sp.]|nr:catalase [Rhizobacter sp.]